MRGTFSHRGRISHASKPGNYTGRHGASELLIEPLELERELVVVDAQAVKKGRIEIPYRDWILDHVIAVVIGLTIGDARTHAASCHPRGVAARMMIASVVILREAALTVDGTAKFTCPDHQRVIEHTALFQVRDQRVAAAIGLLTDDRQKSSLRCHACPIRACKPA